MSRGMRMDRRFLLEARAQAPDGAGGWTNGWTALGELWGRMEAGTGSIRAEDFARLSRVPWRIIVRAAPDDSPRRPRPGQRLRSGARVFAIVAVAEDRRDRRALVCHCHEEAAP